MAAGVAPRLWGREVLRSSVLKVLLSGSDVTWSESRTFVLEPVGAASGLRIPAYNGTDRL